MQYLLATFLYGLLVLAGSAAVHADERPDGMSGSVSGPDWIYPLARGETLESVAWNYLLLSRTWVELIPYNRLESGFDLSAGSDVKIPLAWLRPSTGEAVVDSNGSAWLYPSGNGARKLLRTRTTVQVGDRVKVDSGSASVRFPDGSDMILGPSADVDFNRMEIYGKSGMNDTRLRLRKGRVKLEVRKRHGPEGRFEVQTRNVVAAVRGTTFTLEQNDTGTRIEVHTGSVALITGQSTVDIRAGSGAETAGDNGIRQRALPSVRNLMLQDTGTEQSASRLTASWSANSNNASVQYVVRTLPDSGKTHTVLARGIARSNRLQLPDSPNGRYTLLLQAIDSENYHGRIQRFDYVIDSIAPRQGILEINGSAQP